MFSYNIAITKYFQSYVTLEFISLNLSSSLNKIIMRNVSSTCLTFNKWQQNTEGII